jgi:hypothetical protein
MTAQGTVNVTGTASIDLSVASVQFQVNGANLGSAVTSGTCGVGWDTTGGPDGDYLVTATVLDTTGNTVQSAPVALTVLNAPLQVSGVATSSVTSSSATVTWTTNRPADSSVVYGPTASYGSSTALDATLTTVHTQALTGLVPDTQYHFQAQSRNGISVPAYSADFVFTTATDSRTRPTITWPTPGSIDYGTALSAAQLNATANVAGTFVYTPPAGTLLTAGASQPLTVAFTPTDTTHYAPASASVRLDVLRVTPSITWPTPDSVVDGTVLGPTQLNATANTPGSFTYSPPAGTVVHTGTVSLSTVFTPTDSTNYLSATAGVSLTVVTAFVVTDTAPSASETLFATMPYTITWTAGGGVGGPVSFDVSYSTDSGATFAPVPGCTAVSGLLRACTWASPSPSTTKGRVKVVGRDAAGNLAKGASAADFTVSSKAPSIAVTAPTNQSVWVVGTSPQITWSHNLGLGATVRIDRSLDGGATWAVIADRVASATATTGTFSWLVPNTPSSLARFRVTWLNGPASGLSSSFTIQALAIAIASPMPSANWNIGRVKTIKWTHNLPGGTTVTIQLSRDGGLTWAPLAQLPATGTLGSYDWTVTGPGTNTAMIRVSAPALGTAGTSDAFDIR